MGSEPRQENRLSKYQGSMKEERRGNRGGGGIAFPAVLPALGWSRVDRSSGELPYRQAGHTHFGPKQRAGQRIFAWLEALSRCGYEQLVQVRAAEGAGSDLFVGTSITSSSTPSGV